MIMRRPKNEHKCTDNYTDKYSPAILDLKSVKLV